MTVMPKLVKPVGPLGLALVAWDIWKRIPSRHRKALLKQAKTHGPRIAKQVVDARKAAKKRA